MCTLYELRMGADKIPYVKENTVYDDCLKITKPVFAYELFLKVFDCETWPEEHMLLLCLDSAGGVRGIFDVAHGSVNATLCTPREILQRALLVGAANIILAHNHPSGDTKPSNDDIQAYRKLHAACKVMDIGLLDFMNLGDCCYLSFKEENMMEQ